MRKSLVPMVSLVFLLSGCGEEAIPDAHRPTPRITGEKIGGKMVVQRSRLSEGAVSAHWIKVKVKPPRIYKKIPLSSPEAAAIRYAVDDLGDKDANSQAYRDLLGFGVSAIPFILDRWKGLERTGDAAEKIKQVWGDEKYLSDFSASTIRAAELHNMSDVFQYCLTDMIVFHSNYNDAAKPLPVSRGEWEKWFNKNKKTLKIYLPGQERVRLPFKTLTKK